MSDVKATVTIAERPRWSVATTQEDSGWLRSVRHDNCDVLHYHYGPKEVTFDSPMINATNLLCNGGIPVNDSAKLIVDQLTRGKKPFGEASFISYNRDEWEQVEAEARDHHDKLRDAGLVTKFSITTLEKTGWNAVEKRMFLPGEKLYLYCTVMAAQNIAVADIGPLSQLQSDYEAADLGHRINFKECADLRLSEFVSGMWGFDFLHRNHPKSGGPFLTGLIVGYPVWSTISLYKSGIDDPEDHEE